MKVSAYWIIYEQNTNIELSNTDVFESFGRFIIVLLDLSVTTTLYICVLFICIYIY